jgi:hypothetical protein
MGHPLQGWKPLGQTDTNILTYLKDPNALAEGLQLLLCRAGCQILN